MAEQLFLRTVPLENKYGISLDPDTSKQYTELRYFAQVESIRSCTKMQEKVVFIVHDRKSHLGSNGFNTTLSEAKLS